MGLINLMLCIGLATLFLTVVVAAGIIDIINTSKGDKNE